MSVQEFFQNPNPEKPPIFYVPPPDTTNTAQSRKGRPRQRALNSLTFTPSNSRAYVKCHSGEWDALPYEPPPDYDEDEKPSPNRRWSVATINKSEKPKNHIEHVNIRIPKTKLSKPLDRARSQSPNWNKEVSQLIKGDIGANRVHSKTKGHYELIGVRQPETRQDREREQQVCNCSKTIINSICLPYIIQDVLYRVNVNYCSSVYRKERKYLYL